MTGCGPESNVACRAFLTARNPARGRLAASGPGNIASSLGATLATPAGQCRPVAGDQSRALVRATKAGRLPGRYNTDRATTAPGRRRPVMTTHQTTSPAANRDVTATTRFRRPGNTIFLPQGQFEIIVSWSNYWQAVQEDGPSGPVVVTRRRNSRHPQPQQASPAAGRLNRQPSQSPAARVGGIPVQRRLAQDCAPRGRSRRTRRRVGPLPEQQAPPCARQRGADCVAKATAVTAAATAADDGAPPVEVTGGAATATLSAVSSALATAAGDGAELGRRRRRQGRWQRRGLRRQQRGWWWWRRRRPGRQQRRPGVGNGPLSRAAGTLTETSAIILPGGGQRRGRRATAFTGSTLIRDGVPRCIETVFRLGRHRVCARHAAAPSSATNQNRKYCSRRTWPPAASARRG